MTLRLGVIGVGDVAQRDYLPELSRLEGRAEVAVVCARTPQRARDVASRHDVPRWTTSYDEVVRAPDVDAVLNLTPIQLHTEVTLAALTAGKHVYTEKPLAGSSTEAARIAEAAESHGLVVVAAPCVMLFPQVRYVTALVASGALGRIHSARGLAFAGVPPWQGFISDPSPYFAAGGGPLVDMAVYPLHALTGLLGPVRRVTGLSRRTRESFRPNEGPSAGRMVHVEVDDNWHLVLELASGTLASIQANFCAEVAFAPELELQGERGTVGLSLLDVAEPVRVLVDGVASEEHVQHARAAGPDHLLGVEHLVDCIERSEAPTLSVDHARHVIDVLEAAQSSAASGCTARVSSSFGPAPQEELCVDDN
jgi:predicted dehydrogenase